MSVKFFEQAGISWCLRTWNPSSGIQIGLPPRGRHMIILTSTIKPSPFPILSME
jgi:hypothetical protein